MTRPQVVFLVTGIAVVLVGAAVGAVVHALDARARRRERLEARLQAIARETWHENRTT